MKKFRKFGPGDKVFAKVRGYPPWPARVVGVADESSVISKMKYHIFFYGTHETAVVKAEDVFPYAESVNGKLGKPRKLKGFNDALKDIYNELSEEEKSWIETLPPSDPVDSSILSDEASTPGRRSSIAEKEGRQSTSSESLLPGKSEVATLETPPSSNTPDTSKTSKPRKRKSEMPESSVENFKKAKVEASPSPPVFIETSPTKTQADVTSRSGRKIKPKKFSDFDEVLEQDNLPSIKSVKAASKSDQVKKSEMEKCTEDELIFTHNDETVTIPLNLNRPTTKNHKSALDWKDLVEKYARTLKNKIISGELAVDQVVKTMDEFTREKLNEKKKEYEEDDRTFAILHVEGTLLQIDLKIKSALSLSKANPEECLKNMDEFAALPITALMLKKNPEVVETFKRLRRYVGNTSFWKMSDEEISVFNVQAQNIRNKADHIFNKMKGLFTVPEGKSFWSVFTSQLVDFNKVTKQLSQADFYAITKDPVQS